ncbi:hypothetical protein PspTeo4_28536 [Pseudomonas sp. Teo4]|nr:hypothetical protein [Pseudomonas sp. Teo4]
MKKDNISQTAKRIFNISKVLTIEQWKEPTALIWTTLSPSALFILLLTSRETTTLVTHDYIASASWFYAYISSSVAMFGLSLYLIGRRESGFVRSFIYQRQSLTLFLTSHLLSYSFTGLIHFTTFYLITRPLYGAYAMDEYLHLIACAYISYLYFSCAGLAISLLPIKFTTANTLFSIISFAMLSLGYMGATYVNSSVSGLKSSNPLVLSTKIFLGEIPLAHSASIAFALLSICIFFTHRYFRIQPIWSRY